jgi:hypothetical protein
MKADIKVNIKVNIKVDIKVKATSGRVRHGR